MNFHPIIKNWFDEKFDAPTEVQLKSWPQISQRNNVLLSAPTGSGKTLAAFLPGINQLLTESLLGELKNETKILYISPLKALSNDIRRNLEKPLLEINQKATETNSFFQPLNVKLRTGDTSQSDRAKIVRKPPHILVTTPESLFLLLTSEKGRNVLQSIETVIVDEIHSLARDKRGSHLSLSLARLDRLCSKKPTKIGISATQKPMEKIADFLCGEAPKDQLFSNCEIINTGHLKDLDMAIETPSAELSTLCSHEQWEDIYNQLAENIKSHRSTLVFVNTRRMAERLSFQLSELLGEESITSHHGSLSKDIRLNAEEKLKNGELKAIVATASLELGIDIGYIDLVCQIGSPRSIAVFLQRIGRSGHAVGALPKGRIYPVTRDELLESMSLIQAINNHQLDQIIIPEKPLDILAQQIVAITACEEINVDDLYQLCRNSWTFRELSREQFDATVLMLAEGVNPDNRQGAYIHLDQINGLIRARKHARIAALTSGGAIPENADYRVVTEDGTLVGGVNEDFAIESMRGDVFILGTTSWRIMNVRGTTMTVQDAQGAAATIPFWFGEAPGRSIELSEELCAVREHIAQSLGSIHKDKLIAQLSNSFKMSLDAAKQAVIYIESQINATGIVPTLKHIIFERFFDESGGMQLVVHSPFGSRVNRAWGLAMRKRFCRGFNFELQASADENGFLLSLGPQQSFPLEDMFKLVPVSVAQKTLEQALLAVPLFQIRWRWNATRALAVLRQRGGQRVPPALQRFKSDDLLTSVFPQSTACLEHITGDIEIPTEHPLVYQTLMDCLHEANDLDMWIDVLKKIDSGDIKLYACDTTEPSPFSYQLIHANVYSFLDDAPAEERRTRAISTRRTLNPDDMKDLGWLDREAILKVKNDATPLIRNADELHDTLLIQKLLFSNAQPEWQIWIEELKNAGRAATIQVENRTILFAVERWPIINAIWSDKESQPKFVLPDALNIPFSFEDAVKSITRGVLEVSGPITGLEISKTLGLKFDHIFQALLALEVEGFILRGNYSQEVRDPHQILADLEKDIPNESVQWCERRLLSRIHRLTIDSLRRQIQPVDSTVFQKFLLDRHNLSSPDKFKGKQGFNNVIDQLEGFEIPAASWEEDIFPTRIADYKTFWLDESSMYGETLWCRLKQLPQIDEANTSKLNSSTPISICLRENIHWLIAPNKQQEKPQLRSDAAKVYHALETSGALFSEDLRIAAGQMKSQTEDILWELAGRGLVIADGFASLRKRLSKKKVSRSRRGQRRSSPTGRWNLFPGLLAEEAPQERRKQWAELLLHRYGILFRDLLEREKCAPSWGLLVPVLRRMEARGEIRGGRFINGVGGEQYALPGAVEKLRKMKDEKDSNYTIIPAIEPANLEGIINQSSKVKARRGNNLCYLDGECIAALEASKVSWIKSVTQSVKIQVEQALKLDGKTRAIKKIKIKPEDDNQLMLF
ncbi:MAG: DEAD/DEAH box helicase [Lentisphaeraceae bacterium]|nr:DEAD/DEAH box helicase [Lentisphaeraceae bacterium]